MNTSSLTVVGTGIKFLSHMTTEAKAYIEKSDKVLFLVADPATKQWITEANPHSESLENLYFKHAERRKSYSAITDYIVEHLSQPMHVCIALYGHPTVFAKPALDAVKIAKQLGYKAKILPGISSEDCLFADLLIDPGEHGCQSFESTDFLLRRRMFDSNSHLILWQPDVIGSQINGVTSNIEGVNLLTEHLLAFYPSDHPIIIYEAAQYPGLQPTITQCSLHFLPKQILSQKCTLYIKPKSNAIIDHEYARYLGIDIEG